VYFFVMPPNVQVSLLNSTDLCANGIDGYHNSFIDGVSHKRITYAVSLCCTAAVVGGTTVDVSDIGHVLKSMSHELVEAFTNPGGLVNKAYSGVDPSHTLWSLLSGPEVGDLCAGFMLDPYIILPDMSFPIQRFWSNRSAVAGNNPCVPGPANELYFNSAAVLNDTIPATSGTTSLVLKGVTIPVGQTRTIEIRLFSNLPTDVEWSVSVSELFGAHNLNIQLDRASGKNGDVLHATITVLAQDPNLKGEPFVIVSQLGTVKNFWPGLVGN
jgi:hypothetical protein